MPDFSAVKNAPDISFIDYKTISDVRGEMVADFEDYMTQATGRTVTLARASERRMELYAAAAQIYQAMQFIDRGGKQNLLKYSYSEFLDNLGLWKRVVRLPAKAANTTLALYPFDGPNGGGGHPPGHQGVRWRHRVFRGRHLLPYHGVRGDPGGRNHRGRAGSLHHTGHRGQRPGHW